MIFLDIYDLCKHYGLLCHYDIPRGVYKIIKPDFGDPVTFSITFLCLRDVGLKFIEEFLLKKM